MKTELAKYGHTEQITALFDRCLNENKEAVYSEEFFCPFGVKAAIKRNQIVVMFDGEQVISAVRFYPRKRDQIVSVYQFAVDEKFRGKSLLREMLRFTGHEEFEFICPKDIKFNDFYRKIGANILKQDDKYNYWRLK